MSTKSNLRLSISEQRNALEINLLTEHSAQIVKNLLSMETFKSSNTVALYMAIAGEVNLETLFAACWQRGKRTCIPVFNTTLKCYEMAEITADTGFQTAHYGIKEPTTPVLVDRNLIDLMVLPGVAFDRQGNRLGRGGGYYDRLLDGFLGKTVAVAFDFQVFPLVPTEKHDKPVHSIVTQSEIVEV